MPAEWGGPRLFVTGEEKPRSFQTSGLEHRELEGQRDRENGAVLGWVRTAVLVVGECLATRSLRMRWFVR